MSIFVPTEPLHVQNLAQTFSNRLHLETQRSVVFATLIHLDENAWLCFVSELCKTLASLVPRLRVPPGEKRSGDTKLNSLGLLPKTGNDQ